jgi:hypothetical protein
MESDFFRFDIKKNNTNISLATKHRPKTHNCYYVYNNDHSTIGYGNILTEDAKKVWATD